MDGWVYRIYAKCHVVPPPHNQKEKKGDYPLDASFLMLIYPHDASSPQCFTLPFILKVLMINQFFLKISVIC